MFTFKTENGEEKDSPFSSHPIFFETVWETLV